MVKPVKTPDGQVIHLKTTYTLEDKHDVLYTSGRIIVSSDEKFMLTTCLEDVKVTDLATGRVLQTLKGDGELLTCLSLSPDDTILMTASRSGQLRHWDWQANVCVASFKSPDGPVAAMAWDPTGTLLATGASEGTVKVWDVRKGFITHSFRGSQGIISALEFHPDPKRLWLFSAASADCHVRVWDLFAKKLKYSMESHSSAVRGIGFSADGKHVVTGARDQSVTVWRLTEAGAPRIHMTIPVMEAVEALCVLPKGIGYVHEDDSEFFVTVGDGGAIRVWGLKSGLCIYTADKDGLAAQYTEMTFVPASNTVITVNSSQDIVFHETPTLRPVRHIVGYNDDVIDLKMLDQEHMVVATNSEQVRVLSLSTHDCAVLTGHTAIVLCVDVSRDGEHIVTSSKDGDVRIWRVVRGDRRGAMRFECVGRGVGHTEGVGAVAFSRKSASFAVSGGQDRTVKLWDTEAAIAAGPGAGMAKLHAKLTQKAHDKDINAIAIAPNDKLFCTGSHDRTAKVWSTTDMALLGTLRGHKRGVWGVEFSPVDKCVATASGDKTIKIWSLNDYTCVKTLEGHTAGVLKVAFLSRGMQLASSGADGLCKLWTLKTNECVGTMDGHTDKVWALTINQAEDRIMSGGGDSVISVWRDVTDEVEEKANAEREEQILLEQELQNLVASKQYLAAVRLALRLNQPSRMRTLAAEILADTDQGADRFCGLVKTLSSDHLARLLAFVKEWNTNGKHARVAQAVLACILKSVPPAKLMDVEGIKAILEGLIPYTERHFARIDRLAQQSFLADYTWQGMRHGFDPIDIDAISAQHPLGEDADAARPVAIANGSRTAGGHDEEEDSDEADDGGNDESLVDGNVQFSAVVASDSDSGEGSGPDEEGDDDNNDNNDGGLDDDDKAAGGVAVDTEGRGVKRALASKNKAPAPKKSSTSRGVVCGVDPPHVDTSLSLTGGPRSHSLPHPNPQTQSARRSTRRHT